MVSPAEHGVRCRQGHQAHTSTRKRKDVDSLDRRAGVLGSDEVLDRAAAERSCSQVLRNSTGFPQRR
ncbi:hypothetical protein AV530_004321 [Patagioenas fasciata monilis]|uniref:Uncharacterized protein n=1 Tax=Patagioenas fasciata monilis TaxID=372326 RepID=A0A1V4K945_PATFA|nr:hypothetical protein AV530_004321 [Patagioenas fasciata monilis]